MSGMHRNRINTSPREKRHNRIRLAIQLVFTVLFNGYIAGFANGKIFRGKTKMFCVPVLNCYSCPGALGSCPIGALQSVIGNNRKFPFYVLGTLMLFGILFGRLICGFMCPFGLLQDLLYRIPVKKLNIPKKADRPLRKIKYIILALTILLPVVLVNSFGISEPFFCKYLCPAGTVEGALPNLIANPRLKELIGFLFDWKVLAAVLILLASVFISRFFCKYLCPLGAIYSLFNRFSLYQLKFDKSKCIGCKKCEAVCPMNVEVTKNCNHAECIRCGKCKAVCPENAISSVMAFDKKDEVNKNDI